MVVCVHAGCTSVNLAMLWLCSSMACYIHVCACSFVLQQLEIGMRLNGELLESVKDVMKVGGHQLCCVACNTCGC